MANEGKRRRPPRSAPPLAPQPRFSCAVACGLSAALLQLAWDPAPPCAVPEEEARAAPPAAKSEDACASRRGLSPFSFLPLPGGSVAHPAPAPSAAGAAAPPGAAALARAEGHAPRWLAALHPLRGPPRRPS